MHGFVPEIRKKPHSLQLNKKDILVYFTCNMQYWHCLPSCFNLIRSWVISLNAFLGGEHPERTGWNESVKRQNASGAPFIYIPIRLTCLFNRKWTIFPHTALSVTDTGLHCSCQYESEKKRRKYRIPWAKGMLKARWVRASALIILYSL